MLSSLLRPRKGRRRVEHSPFSSPFAGSPEEVRSRPRGRAGAGGEQEQEEDESRYTGEEETYDELNEDEDDEPLLPIFSAAHLDVLPVYDLTHAIRVLIIQKCETTLSWDQLRSPQISQFLIKPLELQIKSHHFDRSTLLALIANCLQFKKEAEVNLGNSGVNKTRALFAELLAMRLLREYSTRELIDALSYDFDPLKGMAQDVNASGKTSRPRLARISCVEIAIRATAKKFLAHPLVVQQLEAVWAGSIVFHSAADNLHRRPPKKEPARFHGQKSYGAIGQRRPVSPGSPDSPMAGPVGGKSKRVLAVREPEDVIVRRSVTLYDPQDASLFKLSRLRVPRYRQLFSTLSFAVMLVLFLAVLVERSLTITSLEIAFWIYSAGYMLDEVVGFTEQGFGLYIISVWNAFDLGILLLFFTYYILRLYGILVPVTGKHRIANMAYDVLASTAVLLFPRAFSVLDHYRYFSQLLIAFRLMAQDLVAILVLIVISVSGFFVAFVLAFSDENTSSGNVAYAVFQLLMGFTPAAWAVWDQYNILGRIVLTLFLFITHFLVIVILTTVLTNSFMAIVQNANEEHQFLFAVNTISMVKSDALFSYIAPTNVLSWSISPLRFIVPFRQFVKLNRTIIKVTHFPILFAIFAYERLILSKMAYEPTDLVERPLRGQSQPVAFGPSRQKETFQHRSRLREPSVVSFQKDQALDEVFRRPFKSTSMMDDPREDEIRGGRRPSANVVATWMHNVGEEGGASPPMEQPRSILDRLEGRNRPGFRRAMTTDRIRSHRDYSAATRSVLSDPEDRSYLAARRPKMIEEETDPDISLQSIPQEHEGEDGDDELMTHDEAEQATAEQSSETADQTPRRSRREGTRSLGQSPMKDFLTPIAIPSSQPASVGIARSRPGPSSSQAPDSSQSRKSRRVHHDRNASSSTILFQPQQQEQTSSSETPPRVTRPAPNRFPTASQVARPSPTGSRLRPGLPARGSAVDVRSSNALPFSPRRREPSFNTIALDLASDLGDNRFGPAIDADGMDVVPASFGEQLLREREVARRVAEERRRSESEQKEVLSRMVLTRMGTLEEGFKEMLNVVRDLKEGGSSRGGTGSERGGSVILGGNGVGGGVHDRPKSKGTPSGGAGRRDAAHQQPQHDVAGGASDKAPRSPRRTKRTSPLHSGGDGGATSGLSFALTYDGGQHRHSNAEAVAVPDIVASGVSHALPGTTSNESTTTARTIQVTSTRGKSGEPESGQCENDESPSSVRSIVKEIDRRSSGQGSTSGAAQQGKGGVATDRAGEGTYAAVAAGGVQSDGLVVMGGREEEKEEEEQDGEEGARAGKRGSVVFVGKQNGTPGGDTEPQ